MINLIIGFLAGIAVSVIFFAYIIAKSVTDVEEIMHGTKSEDK